MRVEGKLIRLLGQLLSGLVDGLGLEGEKERAQCSQRYDTQPIRSDSSSGGRLARALCLARRDRPRLLRLL